MSDLINLRTLTIKSSFPAGEYAGIPMDNLLKSKSMYLSKVYFTYSKISFTKDILDELKITGDLVIDKPGTNKELFDRWKKEYFAESNAREDKLKTHRKIKSTRTRNAKRNIILIERNLNFSKASLKNKNHGHK